MELAMCQLAPEVPSPQGVLEDLLFHPRLKLYPLSERRAIICHAVYLGLSLEDEARALAECLASWEDGAGSVWRKLKMKRDCEEQLRHIATHRYYLCINRHEDVDSDLAAVDWIKNYAEQWREWWEQQPESSPVSLPSSLYKVKLRPPSSH